MKYCSNWIPAYTMHTNLPIIFSSTAISYKLLSCKKVNYFAEKWASKQKIMKTILSCTILSLQIAIFIQQNKKKPRRGMESIFSCASVCHDRTFIGKIKFAGRCEDLFTRWMHVCVIGLGVLIEIKSCFCLVSFSTRQRADRVTDMPSRVAHLTRNQ